MDISYELYRIFYHAASLGSFSRAAERLYVTQSSVSQSIKNLEEKLGLLLFERHGKRIRLTKEGEVLLLEVSRAVSHFSTAESLMNSYKHLEMGEITVGASDTICRHYILDGLRDFRRTYPGIRLNIINQPSPKTLIAVEKGELDIGFINADENALLPDNIESTIIYELTESFFSKEDPKVSKFSDLVNHPIITLRRNTSTRKALDDLFARNGLELVPDTEVISLDLIIDLVESGFGIGYADKRLASERGLFVIEMKEDMPKRHVLMIVNRNRLLSKAAGSLVRCFT